MNMQKTRTKTLSFKASRTSNRLMTLIVLLLMMIISQVADADDGMLALQKPVPKSPNVVVAGKALCWGNNSYGQLGNGENTKRNVPVDVIGLDDKVTMMTGGFDHTCALLSTGRVKCWGNNSYGQLGNGKNEDKNTPVDVSNLSSGVMAITGGALHTCALLSTGTVKCWGRNDNGQLGNGEKANSNVPVDVIGLAGKVTAITGGDNHTCALLSNGAVQCWGANYFGQLGNGTNDVINIPVDVIDLDDKVTAIAAGGDHTCALLSTGAVQCWGLNEIGQLGNGKNTTSNVPVYVIHLDDKVTMVTGGGPPHLRLVEHRRG